MRNRSLRDNESDRGYSLEERPPFPHNMLMELTNGCNHHCVFCGNHDQRRKIQMADNTLFMRLIDEAYELGTREVGFYLGGEPFLNNELEDYVSFAKEKGYEYIYITTNGMLAKRERVERLAKSGLSSIKFSVNAATRETYKKIHGVDCFDVVYNNISEISQDVIDGKKYDISMFISFIRNRINQGEVELLHEKFDDKVDNIYIFDVGRQAASEANYDEVKLEGNDEKGRNWPCVQLFNRLHVTSQGYLDACCIDYDNSLAIVDLEKVGLENAWYSDRFIKLRRDHLKKEFGNTRCYYCINNISVSGDVNPINEDLY